MKSPVSLGSLWMRPARRLTVGLLMAALPCLAGCPGSLEGDFSSISNADSGASSGSGGDTGTGGTAVSTGGTVGSGGVVGTGGVAGTGGTAGTGGMVGTGGKAGGSGAAGKSGTGGVVGAGGRGGMKGSAGGGSGTTTCDAPTMVFKDATVGCLGGGCHSAGAQNQTPDLQTADPTVLKAYKTTILCMGGTLVVPSNPTSSVLYKVVDGMSCGIQMPLGKPTLSAAQEACLAAWISNL